MIIAIEDVGDKAQGVEAEISAALILAIGNAVVAVVQNVEVAQGKWCNNR